MTMPARTIKKNGPRFVDVHVGKRLRMRRTLRGLSQEQVAGALGLTFQQLQKYEKGSNRISAGRLYDLGEILEVPVSFFSEGIPSDPKAHNRAAVSTSDEEPEPLNKRGTLEFVRAYYRIKEPAIRDRIVTLTRAMAS